MNESKTLFGRRLRVARLNKGISQRKLGIAARIDEFSASARVNQYEVGTHTPSFQTATMLADVLEVPTPYFYAEDELLAEAILSIGRLKPNQIRKVLKLIDLEGGTNA